MRQYESVIIQRETEALKESLTTNNARSESLARAGRMLRAVLRRIGGEDVRVYEAYLQAVSHGGRSTQPSREASSTSETSVKPEQSGVEGEAEPMPEGSRKDKGKERDEGTQTDAEAENAEEDVDVDRALEEEDDPEKRLAAAEWALERESELARLERENEELRALVNGLLKPTTATASANSNSKSTTPVHQRTDSAPSTAPITIPEHPDGEGGEGRASEESAFSTLPRPQQQQRLLGGRPGTVGPFGTYKKSTVVIRVDR